MLKAMTSGLRDLYPGYFSLVMATGIVSLACNLEGLQTPAWWLFCVNNVAYVVLWLAYGLRLLFFPHRMAEDFGNHQRGPGFLTLVAATCILGNQYLVMAQRVAPAHVLWGVGLALWAFLLYGFLAAVTVREEKPTLESGLNGGWLLMVVSTQAVALLSTLLAPHLPGQTEVLLFMALCLHFIGCMLYTLILALMFYRWTFFRLPPESLAPPYWIMMGALAITTRTGATLIVAQEHWQFLLEIRPFLVGLTLFHWAIATWWIPLLLLLGIWRHIRREVPLSYDPQYWGMVFPLGMYSVCTHQLSRLPHLSFLAGIPRIGVYIALSAWAVVSIGLLHHWIRQGRLASIHTMPLSK